MAVHVQAIHSHTGRTTQHNPVLLRIKPKEPRALHARLLEPPRRKGDHRSTLRTCLPICRLQKFHLGTRGAHLHMHASNGKPELAGGAHTRFPRAVSALIMDLSDKNFSSSDTSRPQNQNPGLLPVPYHQISITSNINKLLLKS